MRRKKRYDSMASAAAGEKISLELVRRAKRAGCAAFRGSRVDAAILRKFISEEGSRLAGEEVSLKDKKLSEEIRKLRIRNDREERKTVAVTDVESLIQRVCSAVPSYGDQKLVIECAMAVTGLAEVPQVRIVMKRYWDDVCKFTQTLAAEWKLLKKP